MKVVAIAAALSMLVALGCASENRHDARSSASEARAVTRPTASEWLSDVMAAHDRADAALAAAEIERAHAALSTTFAGAVPAGVRGEHARAVRQDLAFRLAELELGRDRPEAGLLRADAGLALGRGDDLFTANLLVARGHALAALGRDTEAASSYHEALEINARLLRAALEPHGGSEP